MVDTDTDEEDVYFTPASSSNLASLFNTTMKPLQKGKDVSLTYKPPKQPNLAAEQKVNKATYESIIIIFKQVQAFQIINKDNLPLGKCGFTLVGNEKMNIYQLLIYKNKDNIISSSKPTSSLEIRIEQNNYISFTDDNNLVWAIHFDTEDDLNEFLKMVVIKCQCKVTKKPEGPISVEKAKLENNGDNTKKKDMSDNSNEIGDEEKCTEVVVGPTKPDKTNVKDKVLGLNQVPKYRDGDASDSSEAMKKADIMNRVAKMGKKLIETDPLNITDISDSSDFDEKPNTAILKVKKTKLSKHNLIDKPIISYHTDRKNTSNSHLVPYQENTLSLPSSVTTEQLNMFFIENKNSTTEIKLSMLKLQNEVQEVLKIVKKGESDTRNMSTQTDGENLVAENQKLLLLISKQNDTLEKLKENNENLRNKNEELITKATATAYETVKLIEKNAKYFTDLQNLNEKLHDLEGELKDKHAPGDSVMLKKTMLVDCESKIKLQMNTFFTEACECYDDSEQYEGRSIKKHLGQTIIHNTYPILKTIKEMFNN